MSGGSITDAMGQAVAYFDPKKRLLQVKLSGPPVGPVVGPSDIGDGLYLINIRWSEDERARWEAYKQAHGNAARGRSDSEDFMKPPRKKVKLHGMQRDAIFTLEEKRWLKVHYGGEFNFLQVYGLSIHENGDREEGRVIMWAFMDKESPEGREFVDALLESDDEVLVTSTICSSATDTKQESIGNDSAMNCAKRTG